MKPFPDLLSMLLSGENQTVFIVTMHLFEQCACVCWDVSSSGTSGPFKNTGNKNKEKMAPAKMADTPSLSAPPSVP